MPLGELAALTTALLWTFSSVFLTAAGKRIGALNVSFLRVLLACVLMAAHGWLTRGRWWPSDADARTWWLLGISGFFGFFLCDVCLFKAMLLISPRLTLLIFSLTPPLAAVFSWCASWFSHGDVLALKDWAAMAVTLAGVTWVVLEGPTGNDTPESTRSYTRGVSLAGIAAATSAIGLVFSRAGIGQYDAVAATLVRGLAALPGYVLLFTLLGRWKILFGALGDRLAMGPLMLGAVMGPFAGNVFVLVALRYSPPGVVATITATMPVLILPLSTLVYHEQVSRRAVAGAVLAVLGVALLML